MFWSTRRPKDTSLNSNASFVPSSVASFCHLIWWMPEKSGKKELKNIGRPTQLLRFTHVPMWGGATNTGWGHFWHVLIEIRSTSSRLRQISCWSIDGVTGGKSWESFSENIMTSVGYHIAACVKKRDKNTEAAISLYLQERKNLWVDRYEPCPVANYMTHHLCSILLQSIDWFPAGGPLKNVCLLSTGDTV